MASNKEERLLIEKSTAFVALIAFLIQPLPLSLKKGRLKVKLGKMQPGGQVKGDPGVLSFEKGFIFLIYHSNIDQASHKRDLHWIFCERSQS